MTKIALLLVALTTTASVQAEWVRGHYRRNGTYVAPYYRTPANGIPYDNLSYRGYPSQQPGYTSPRTYSFGAGSRASIARLRANCDTAGSILGGYSPRSRGGYSTAYTPFSWRSSLLPSASASYDLVTMPSLSGPMFDW